MSQKFICGPCGRVFGNAQDELNHDCKVLGCKPTEPESMGPGWERIAEAAQERGAERRAESANDVASLPVAPPAKKVKK